MYKILKDVKTGTDVPAVLRTLDNAFIPFDEQNTDYQAYLKYVEQGGLVLPADAAPDEAQQ